MTLLRQIFVSLYKARVFAKATCACLSRSLT
ncbi:Uncharacterised protein [Vibrio cholerae]|nr:Uncharacterised protein [Vibrio cholerae]